MINPPYLSAKNWIDYVKNVVRGKDVQTFFRDDKYGGHYLLNVGAFEWSDLVKEVYGDQDPMSYEHKSVDFNGNVNYEKRRYSEDMFNEKEDFVDRMVPALNEVAKETEKLLGGEYFYVDYSFKDGDATVDFYFLAEDIADLIQKGFQFKSLLFSAIQHAEPTFAEFEGPLFERATVSVKTQKSPDGKEIPDPSTAQLHLPEITVKESQAVNPNFDLKVKQSFEDQFATKRTYEFNFRVSDLKFTPQSNGLVKPVFKAQLKEYKNA